jgi:flagellar FliJ protein
MKRLQTLLLLLEKERRKRDEAQAAVRGANANLEQQQAQGEGLATYRVEYCAKWSTRFQQGSSMEILRSYHGFMARLEQAIAQQQAVIAHAQRGVDAARERLVEREIRVATVERLIERRRELLARVEDRREQKTLDEMAARRPRPKALAGLA